MIFKIDKHKNKAHPEMRVAFVCYSPNGSYSSFIKADYKIISKYFYTYIVSYRRMWDSLAMMMIIWRSDVSLTWFAGGHAFLAVLFSKILRKKAIIIAGGFDVAYVPEINYGRFTQSWHKKMFTQFALNYADLVLSVSDFTKTDVLSHSKPKNIITLYNGIDTNKFKRWGEKCNLVITVASGSGNIIKLKGLSSFIMAATYIPEAKFVVLGLSETDMRTLKTLNPPRNMKLFGSVSQEVLIKWYQKAKVYCQLSYRESFGMALAEAMSCECVPVVTKRGALQEVVGDTGFYVPYGNPDATAKAIKKALNSSENLGKKSRERVENMFSIEKRATGLVETIRGYNN